jgi:hypothetical protein
MRTLFDCCVGAPLAPDSWHTRCWRQSAERQAEDGSRDPRRVLALRRLDSGSGASPRVLQEAGVRSTVRSGGVAGELDRLGLNKVMKIQEITTKPKAPMTPDQARIEGLKAQAKRSQEAVKAERARQKVKAGQQALADLNLNRF